MALLRMDWVRVAELGEGDVVDEQADDDDHKAKEHGLPADRLNEAVEDGRERVRTDSCAAHLLRIPVHARVPVITKCRHGWYTCLGLAAILAIISGAHGHLGQCFCDGAVGLDVDIALNGAPERVDDPDDAANEEEVEYELGVEGQGMRKVRM